MPRVVTPENFAFLDKMLSPGNTSIYIDITTKFAVPMDSNGVKYVVPGRNVIGVTMSGINYNENGCVG